MSVNLPRDHSGAKAFEVFGINLAVDEFNAFVPKPVYKLYKCILAGVARFAEHAFAEEDLFHADTV